MSGLDDARALMGAAERDLRALRGMEDAVVFADEIAGFHRKTGFTIFDFSETTDFQGDDDAGVVTDLGRPLYGPCTWRTLLALDKDGRIACTEAHEARASLAYNTLRSWRNAEAFDAERGGRLRPSVSALHLSVGRYRPQNRAQIEHRNPLEILDEIRAMEQKILEEIDQLAHRVREAVGE